MHINELGVYHVHLQLLLILFPQVNPTYEAAVEALRCLQPQDVDEIRSYRVPPEGMLPVIEAICLLFGEEQS